MSSQSSELGPSAVPVTAPSPTPNPWADVKPPSPKPVTEIPSQELLAAPPNAFDDAVLPPTPSKTNINPDVLNEFDPLADKVEANARDAWAAAEGHPPPRPPAPPPKAPLQETLRALTTKVAGTRQSARRPSTVLEPPTSAAANVTTFSTLASLAKSSFTRRRASSAAQPPGTPTTATVVEESSNDVGHVVSPIPASPLPPPTPSKDNHSSMGDPSKADPPFDFQKFLDQMKMKSAEPVAKYLRSFLSNFSKRNFTVNDQIKLIRDFLTFINGKMRVVEPWKNASEAEFDNASEAMEKLVMNRLYEYTFTPMIDTATHSITTDDLERDHVLRQRMKLFKWVTEDHLDVPKGEGSQGFMSFAEQELIKMNHYKAPRDKLICILNCCKVIFGLIRHLQKDEGADSFIPILIFVVLQANPEHLISNIEYINRFRSPSKLSSESGYYLSSLMGAVSFIETMDHTSLSNITQEEFEKNVESAIQALPPSPSATDRDEDPARITTPVSGKVSPSTPAIPHSGEEPAIPLKLPSTATLAEDTKRFLQRTGDSISKPLNAIGKIFNEALDGLDELERQRQEAREREAQQQAEGGPDQGGLLSQMSPEWLFGSGTNSPRLGPATPIGSPIPSTPGPQQTPYRPRVRPGSAGPSSGPSSIETPPWNRNSSYQPIPAASFHQQSPQSGLSRSLPGDHRLEAPPAQRQGQPAISSLQLDPRLSHLQPGMYGDGAASNPSSRAPSPLDLTALQHEIDRAHSVQAEAARGTLTQMFPTADPEVVDMVLEANRGDLGQSIESMLEMMAT